MGINEYFTFDSGSEKFKAKFTGGSHIFDNRVGSAGQLSGASLKKLLADGKYKNMRDLILLNRFTLADQSWRAHLALPLSDLCFSARRHLNGEGERFLMEKLKSFNHIGGFEFKNDMCEFYLSAKEYILLNESVQDQAST